MVAALTLMSSWVYHRNLLICHPRIAGIHRPRAQRHGLPLRESDGGKVQGESDGVDGRVTMRSESDCVRMVIHEHRCRITSLVALAANPTEKWYADAALGLSPKP